MRARLFNPKHYVSPLQAVVLLHNIVNCKEASNDADRTVGEIIADLDEDHGMVSKGLLESALYCCNMRNEDQAFWHPLGHNFDRFLKGLLNPKHYTFDKYYNVIYEVAHVEAAKVQGREAVGSDPQQPGRDTGSDEVL